MKRPQGSSHVSRRSAVAEHDDNERRAKELISEIKHGNQEAFTELVRRYRSQVAALAFKMVNDYDEAADIAQNVFVKVARNVWRYDERKKFYTWLHRITVNAAIDHMRKHKRHRHEPLETFQDVIETPGGGPEADFRRQRLGHYIAEASRSLSDKQYSAFVLRDLEGCRIDDVADIMNVPEATVRWYLHRGRAKIRKELLRRCPHLLLALGLK
jgi:RNA polymerase sigma-70 factor (ECF subfamily)